MHAVVKESLERYLAGALAPVGKRAVRGRVGRPGELYRFQGPLMGTWNRELPWHEGGIDHAS